MEPAKMYEPYVDVEMSMRGSLWLLRVTMGVLDPYPSGLHDENALSSRPFVTFKAGQHPSFDVPVSSRSNWATTRSFLVVDPNQALTRLFLIHWNHFGRDRTRKLEIDMWEVIYDFAPPVSRQTFLYSSCNSPVKELRI